MTSFTRERSFSIHSNFKPNLDLYISRQAFEVLVGNDHIRQLKSNDAVQCSRYRKAACQ
ncbi:hypothetical protein OIU84_015628 [Salix udensis]|uniref:Uncharacterized protein n=1 Tax=Salix udensis TaxID=889485 RepID=A0AAD6J8D5_9ROSI|nr:hypothetical protein OIU84_015628 [Salix udensis]